MVSPSGTRNAEWQRSASHGKEGAELRICTPSKDENPQKQRSIVTSALALAVSLYECRHMPNLHTGVEASCMEIFLSKNPTGFQPVALSFFAASGSYASLTPLRVCISTFGMSNGSSLGKSSVPTQL